MNEIVVEKLDKSPDVTEPIGSADKISFSLSSKPVSINKVGVNINELLLLKQTLSKSLIIEIIFVPEPFEIYFKLLFLHAESDIDESVLGEASELNKLILNLIVLFKYLEAEVK